MKTAIVHDWLVSFAGSERVVYELSQMYPDAPIYTSVYDEKAVGRYFPKERVRTTFLQKIPGAVNKYQSLLPLMPIAFEQLDLREFDLIISSSHACSKGILTRSDAVHICYCHTPIRYVWSHYHEYIKTIKNAVSRRMASIILHRLRIWDYIAAQRVDKFIANSVEVQKRIKKYYGKDSEIIHPPVDFHLDTYSDVERIDRSNRYLLSLGRLVPYKRVDLAVAACTALGVELRVAGDGPELQRLKKRAGPTIEFLGHIREEEKVKLLRDAGALLFCGEEDFGIVPVEANCMGVPVIAYGKGGILDTIQDGVNGVLFREQTVSDVVQAIERFKSIPFHEAEIRKQSVRFSVVQFREKFQNVVREVLHETSS